MRAGYHHLRPAGGAPHFDDIDLQPVALVQLLAAYLLAGGQQSVRIFGVGADLDGRRARARVDAGNDAGQYLVLLAGELVIYHPAFRLAYALDDDLLGSLGGDAAEFLRLHGDGDGVAHTVALGELVRAVHVDLRCRVLDLVHNSLVYHELDALLVLVEDDFHIFPVLRVVLAEGGEHGLLYLLIHVAAGDALFLLDVLNSGEKLCVHLPKLLLISSCAASPGPPALF